MERKSNQIPLDPLFWMLLTPVFVVAAVVVMFIIRIWIGPSAESMVPWGSLGIILAAVVFLLYFNIRMRRP